MHGTGKLKGPSKPKLCYAYVLLQEFWYSHLTRFMPTLLFYASRKNQDTFWLVDFSNGLLKGNIELKRIIYNSEIQ